MAQQTHFHRAVQFYGRFRTDTSHAHRKMFLALKRWTICKPLFNPFIGGLIYLLEPREFRIGWWTRWLFMTNAVSVRFWLLRFSHIWILVARLNVASKFGLMDFRMRFGLLNINKYQEDGGSKGLRWVCWLLLSV